MSTVAYLMNIKTQCLHSLLIHCWAATDSLFSHCHKIDEEMCPKSTENRSNFNPKSTKTLPWTGLCGAMGGLGWQVGDQGRLWQVLDPPNPPDGTVLSPSWSHVGAKLKYFGVESVILEVWKSKINSSRNSNRSSQSFEAKARWSEGHSVL